MPANQSITISGGNLNLKPPNSSSNDSDDIVWFYGNDQEKMRIWSLNEYTAAGGPQYRVYKSDGTSLYTGRLVIGNSVGSTGQPVYIDGEGVAKAIDWHIGNSSVGEHNANNITYNMIGYYNSNGPSNASSIATFTADTSANGAVGLVAAATNGAIYA